MLEFVFCLDYGFRIYYFKKESWIENLLIKVLVVLKNDSNLTVLWKNMLSKMYFFNMDNELIYNLFFLFVIKFIKRRCNIYLVIDGFGLSFY